MKKILAIAFIALSFGIHAEKIKKHVDGDGFEDWYWKGSVKVSRGSAHTFWIKGLTENTAITDMDVYCEYTYKEDGETYEDTIYASYSCEVENSSGGWDKYVLLTYDDWDGVPDSKSSLTFTVYVGGWGGDEYTSSDLSFTFGHADGESSFPGEQEPVYVPPKGTSDNPQTITLTELKAGESPATDAKMVDCDVADDVGSTYYIKTSSLTAGHKYFFGIDGGTDLRLMPSITSGANLFEDASLCKVYEGWANASEAYEFVPTAGGVYYLTVNVGAASEEDYGVATFSLYHTALPTLRPDKHVLAGSLVVGETSEEFKPGYKVDPESSAYDEVIDQCLFEVTGFVKGKSYIIATEGADAPLMMRLYDANGNVIKENLYAADGAGDVRIGWIPTIGTATTKYYVGVCQRLEDDEEPTAGAVTLSVKQVTLVDDPSSLEVVPTTSAANPFDVAEAIPSPARTLSDTEWANTFTLAGRKDVEYHFATRLAQGGSDNSLALKYNVYKIAGTTKKPVNVWTTSGYQVFTADANTTIYIEVSVADGDWKNGTGLDYGPYEVCAVAVGDYGVLKVDMKGAPDSAMGWKILKKNGTATTGEDFYPAGSTAILGAGSYTLAAKEAKGFAKPDTTKGFGSYDVKVGETKVVSYKYTDTSDPLDNSPDTKAIEPSTKKKYAPAKLDPKSGKPATAARTLWTDDSEDWYTVAASAGCYYRFLFAEKAGAPKMTVYGPDSWTTELGNSDFVIFDDPESKLQMFAASKGTYYVKVSHLDDANRTDSSYTLEASMANPGLVKFGKTDVSAKDSAAYVDLSVSRTGKDGLVRVKYRTVGAQTDKDDAYYYPTNGVLEWAANDNKAKTVRVRLVPNDGWASNKVVKVVLEPFATDDATFNQDVEYPASFDVDKQGKVLDTATITIAATAKKAPGTIRAVCGDPKKPVFTVTAGETLEIPFERALGADGIVGVRVETSKGTANKSGEVDFTPVVVTNIWAEGETDVRTVSVETKAVAGDYTGVKTFTLKLTALASAKNDPVQYDKPTLASSSVTVNIVNDKFADSFDSYAKTVTDAANGYTVKEGKKGTWVVLDDGSFYAPNKGDLTFTFKTTGKFTYTENGVVKTFTATASNKTLKITGASTFSVDSYELDGEPVVLRQGVKYSTSFGTGGTIKASNLPTGLKLEQNKTTKEWTVAGVPSKAGVFQALVGTSNICYTVAAEGTAAGTFNGLATTFDTTNGVASLASVTITAALGGKLSASVNVAGKKYSFADTGYSYVTEDPSDPEAPAYATAELALVQKIGSGATAQTVTNWLYYTVLAAAEADPAGWYAEGEVEILMTALPDAKGNGYQEDVWYSGKVYRDGSKIADKTALAAWQAEAAKYAGYYTVSLVAPDAMPGEPRGSGYMTMTLDAKGKAKLAGKLADGTAYSGSAVAALVGEEDSPAVRVPLYAQKGNWVFGGWLSVRENEAGDLVAEIGSPDTDIVWKNDDPLSTRDGEEGFALYLYPVGGWYDTVSNLQRSYLESDLAVNLPEGEDALEEIMDALALDGGYAFVAQPSGQAVDLLGNTLSVAKLALVKDVSKKLNDWDASVNASNVKITFKRATGVVSGSFDLWYEGTNTKGVEQKSVTGLKHEGVIVLMRGDDGYLEDDVLSSGFFIAPQKLKYTDAKGKTQARTWNGSYRFDINAVPVERVWTDVE